MSTNLEYRAGERQRKGERRRQASEAQREKGRQSLERGIKNKGDIFFLEEQQKDFVAAMTMLAATNAGRK